MCILFYSSIDYCFSWSLCASTVKSRSRFSSLALVHCIRFWIYKKIYTTSTRISTIRSNSFRVTLATTSRCPSTIGSLSCKVEKHILRVVMGGIFFMFSPIYLPPWYWRKRNNISPDVKVGRNIGENINNMWWEILYMFLSYFSPPCPHIGWGWNIGEKVVVRVGLRVRCVKILEKSYLLILVRVKVGWWKILNIYIK